MLVALVVVPLVGTAAAPNIALGSAVSRRSERLINNIRVVETAAATTAVVPIDKHKVTK
jgi:hypothetical protein